MTKPNALQLSEALYAVPETGAFPEDIEAAADELCRLHEANQELLEALKNFTDGCSTTVDAFAVARAAIAKGEQS